MSKSIKDYLHLYIGCKVQCIESSQELLRVHALSTGTIITMTANKFFTVLMWPNSFELLLRWLPNMTDEEFLWLAKEISFHPGGLFGDEITEQHKGEMADEVMDHATPRVFQYLLSQGFDLFGLIPAGLAIDQSTITSNLQPSTQNP